MALWRRLSCLGSVKDLVLYGEEKRLFWMANIAGSWVLMVRDMWFEGDNTEVLKEGMVVNVGGGVYRGLDFVGSKEGNWSIVYSVDGVLYLMRLTGEVDRVVFFEELYRGGVYPFMFRNEVMEMNALLYYDVINGGWRIKFSGDMVNWTKGSVSVNRLRKEVREGFINKNTEVNLNVFLNILGIADEKRLGNVEGFLY